MDEVEEHQIATWRGHDFYLYQRFNI